MELFNNHIYIAFLYSIYKNLNTNNNQQVRITIEGGQSSGSFNPTINGTQTGAFELLENNTDLRVCLAPLTTSDCDGAINVSSLLSITGMFDFYLDDLTTPLYTNISPEELITLLQNNDDIEIIES